MTTAQHRAATPPTHRIGDLLADIVAWAQAWEHEINRAAVIDFRPLINAWHALVAWVRSLADRWETRRNAELSAVAELTRQSLLAWSAEAEWACAIKLMAQRRTGVTA
jgi:hypothetical protein